MTLSALPGTNIVYNEHFDGNVVWLDLDDPNPARRFKQAAVLEKNKFQCYTILESPDGIHWNTTNPCTGALNNGFCSKLLLIDRLTLGCSGPIEDRSSIFLNPMRTPRQWVYSIKSGPAPDQQGPYGRSRSYCEILSEPRFASTC